MMCARLIRFPRWMQLNLSPSLKHIAAVVLTLGVVLSLMIYAHPEVLFELADTVVDAGFRAEWGHARRVLGGMHSLGSRSVPVVGFVTVLDDEEVSIWLPRDIGRRKSPLPPQESTTTQYLTQKCIGVLDEGYGATPERGTASGVHTLTYEVNSRDAPSWNTIFQSELVREFGLASEPPSDSDVPLLQPLWGTLHLLKNEKKIPLAVLDKPPSLPQPTNSCSQVQVLIALPSRISHFRKRLNPSDTNSINLAAIVAERLMGEGPNPSVSFAIPILLGGGSHFISTLPSPIPPEMYWGLLGLGSSAQFGELVSAVLKGNRTVVTKLSPSPVHITKVQPISKTGAKWCEEVTVSMPVELSVKVDQLSRAFQIALSITELECKTKSVPGIENSLATAVHIGALLGGLASSTHLVVLKEDTAVHTLVAEDSTLYRALRGGVPGLPSNGGFLEHLLSPWNMCAGPHASQAVSLIATSPMDTKSLAVAPISNMNVEHHGINFAFKALQIPSAPTRHAALTKIEGSRCDGNTPCVNVDEMVNSVFHPFSSLEGIVPIRRRHLLPGRSRRVLGVVSQAESRDVLNDEPHGRLEMGMVDAITPSAVCILTSSFHKVNGYFGQGSSPPVEDVAGALTARLALA